MIENSDRGITLAKPLAWTMLVSVISAVWYGGSTVSSLGHSTQAMVDAMSAQQSAIQQVEVRVRTLENNASRQDARFDGLKQALVRVNGANSFRVEFVRSAGAMVSADTTNVTAGNNRALTFSGWVKLA